MKFSLLPAIICFLIGTGLYGQDQGHDRRRPDQQDQRDSGDGRHDRAATGSAEPRTEQQTPTRQQQQQQRAQQQQDQNRQRAQQQRTRPIRQRGNNSRIKIGRTNSAYNSKRSSSKKRDNSGNPQQRQSASSAQRIQQQDAVRQHNKQQQQQRSSKEQRVQSQQQDQRYRQQQNQQQTRGAATRLSTTAVQSVYTTRGACVQGDSAMFGSAIAHRSWQSEHRTWQQRGGYSGYRIPNDRFRGYFGRDHRFRINALPLFAAGGYPRFQYNGFWFSLVDPWPEYWSDDWYDTDDVYVDYSGDGYYLYDQRYPNDRIAISVSVD